jgi:hypothetical protein
MNSLSVIIPYKQYGMWMFDDARVGLEGELFIAGADMLLEHLTEKIPNAEKGFRLLFSVTPFPGYWMRLEWIREDTEMPGNWYRWAGTDLEGWLCPALFKYFAEAPLNLYLKAEALET